jgi:serine/threonine-protein kinase
LGNALRGRYEFRRELGSGGMATVYVAHDVRHERDVAVKVLHPDLGAVLGGERFLSEIKTTARLQHPHILPLLDSGEADGLLFYVMPLVEGQTLRMRLERERQLPIDEALRIATEVASALDYAHRHGVIHRDIKPENILLHDGRAVVADFGIALAVTAASGTRMTQTGLSLGTPQYMAPEQAMGEKVIDARADVYALGAVTYEMLTGEPPFSGATVQAIVAKVLTEKPMSLTAIRDSAPRHVEATVNKALSKLPADRFATAAQFADALAQPQLTAGLTSALSVDAVRQTGWRRYANASPAIWAALALTGAVALAGWLRGGAEPFSPAPVARFSIPPGAILHAPVPSLAISNDGSRIAFAGFDSTRRRLIFIRSLDRFDPAPVPGTLFASSPFFSPSGDTLGFLQDQKLRFVPLRGGSVTTIADWSSSVFPGASWGDDGSIVFSKDGVLHRVHASDGTQEIVARREGIVFARPHFLPGSKVVLAMMSGDSGGIVSIRLRDTSITRVAVDGDYPQYTADGALIIGRSDGTIHAVAFDANTARVTGSPDLITDLALTGGASISKFGVARNGTIVHMWGSRANRQLVLVDRKGAVTKTLLEEGLYRFPRFSPDGRHLAFHLEIRGGVNGDIWSLSLENGGRLRLTSDSMSAQPVWDPDGKSLVFINRGGLQRVVADGSRPPSALVPPAGNGIFESQITPDRHMIVYRMDESANNRNIFMAPLDSPTAARPVLTSPFDEKGFALSPDGKWLAYASNETGADELYVRRLQENSARWPVSRGGGREARWVKDEIFYRTGDSIMVARISLGEEPSIGPPQLLFRGNYASTGYEPLYDVSPDGTQLALVVTPDAGRTQIGVIMNWTANWKGRQQR